MNRRARWLMYIAIMPLAGVFAYLIVWLIRKRQHSLEREVDSIELSSKGTVQRQAPGEWLGVAPEQPERVDQPPKAESISVEADDLKKIKGIGPKIAYALETAGIVRFDQLAEAAPGDIEDILRKSGIRLANMDTWKAQAQLAADGDWDSLQTLQADLRGGRRI